MVTTTLENIKNTLASKLEADALSDDHLYDIIGHSVDIVASDARQFKKKQITFDAAGNYHGLSDIRVIRIDPTFVPQVTFNEVFVKTFNQKYNAVDFTYDGGVVHASELANTTCLITYLQNFSGTDNLFDSLGQIQPHTTLSMSKFEYDLLMLHTEAHAVERITQTSNSSSSAGGSSTIGTTGVGTERSVQFGQFRISEKTENRTTNRTSTTQSTSENLIDDLASYLMDRYDQMIQRIAPRGMTSSR